MKKTKRDFLLGLEKLDNKTLLSGNPWYVDAIKAPEVWGEVSSVTTKPVVAIVDSGVDLTHPSLINNLFHNPLDPVDGKDNDNNGYVDDNTGWDFVQNDASPQDELYHGTHVAGIVSTIGNSNVSILPLKFIGSSGSGYTGAAVAAIDYAINLKNRGINIVAINCSFGGLLNNTFSLDSAIKRASDNGIVVVLAAGNNGSDLDVTPRYPGSLNYTNTITVAGTNNDNTLAGYSNYGKNTVTVAAPGSNIYSTLPGGAYGNISGTSMSTAVVSGAVGLLNKLGHYGATVIKNALINGCDLLNSLVDKIKYGFINLQQSMSWLKTQPESVVQPLVPTTPPVVVSPVISPKISLAYKFDAVSRTTVKGWASVVNSSVKPVVEIYINKVLRYSVSANQYRSDTRLSNGFSVSINRKFLTLRSNLVEVKIKDSMHRLETIAYKGYIRR